MTKQEAIQAMNEGKKVTHQHFTDDEWMKLAAPGLYEFEDGYEWPSLSFWEDRKDDSWETGWSIFEPVK